jgi:hypothetical protein
MNKIKYVGAILALQLLPAVALAVSSGNIPNVTFSFSSLSTLFDTIVTWFAGIIFILGIACILYAAFMYMTAAGDEEKVGKAKRTFIYGLVGIGVAILAFGIWTTVQSLLSGA